MWTFGVSPVSFSLVFFVWAAGELLCRIPCVCTIGGGVEGGCVDGMLERVGEVRYGRSALLPRSGESGVDDKIGMLPITSTRGLPITSTRGKGLVLVVFFGLPGCLHISNYLVGILEVPGGEWVREEVGCMRSMGILEAASA